MKLFPLFLTLPLLLVCLVVPRALAARDTPAPADGAAAENEPKKVELNDLERAFEKTMTGATLVGRSSMDGKEDRVPAPDQYVITKVTKIGADLWLFTARIGDGKLAIPMPVPVKWAGDTPVISLTKMTIPTKGTFSARVVIYGDRYAGTWDGGDHAGQLWGKIERSDGPASAPASAPASDRRPTPAPAKP